MVGTCRTYFSGKAFFLSDHFGLLGLLDVHAAYGTAGGGDSGVARRRRHVLGSLRTESVMTERVATRERERQGEEQRALAARRADERKSQDTLADELRTRQAERDRREKLLEEAQRRQTRKQMEEETLAGPQRKAATQVNVDCEALAERSKEGGRAAHCKA